MQRSWQVKQPGSERAGEQNWRHRFLPPDSWWVGGGMTSCSCAAGCLWHTASLAGQSRCQQVTCINRNLYGHLTRVPLTLLQVGAGRLHWAEELASGAAWASRDRWVVEARLLVPGSCLGVWKGRRVVEACFLAPVRSGCLWQAAPQHASMYGWTVGLPRYLCVFSSTFP